MCLNFSTELYVTLFYKFLELFMNIFVPWCQLLHLPMVSVIVVYKNKATNAASKLLYDIFNIFLAYIYHHNGV